MVRTQRKRTTTLNRRHVATTADPDERGFLPKLWQAVESAEDELQQRPPREALSRLVAAAASRWPHVLLDVGDAVRPLHVVDAGNGAAGTLRQRRISRPEFRLVSPDQLRQDQHSAQLGLVSGAVRSRTAVDRAPARSAVPQVRQGHAEG